MSGQQFSEVSIGTAAADEFVRLPRLPALFERRSARIAELARGHPLAGFLLLAENIFRAQAMACVHSAPVAPPPPEAILQAREHGMPVLSPADWAPARTYRETLRFLTAQVQRDGLPGPAIDVLDALGAAGDTHLDMLARDYLTHAVTPPWQGEALFVAAALQVEFARTATLLEMASLKPLEVAGLCPVCGSAPVAGVVVADSAYGRRYLTCGLCSTSWHHVRVSCIVCGGEGKVAYHSIEGGSQYAKAETCDDCKNYSKIFYQTRETMAVEAMCDDLATLALDLLVTNAGWTRHAPNPFVLVL